MVNRPIGADGQFLDFKNRAISSKYFVDFKSTLHILAAWLIFDQPTGTSARSDETVENSKTKEEAVHDSTAKMAIAVCEHKR